MSLSVSFRHSARAEFIEAAAWYESERQNLGVEFIVEIERCVAAAAERPMQGPGLPAHPADTDGSGHSEGEP